MIISGNLPYRTEVASVFVFNRIQSGDRAGAAAVAVVLLAHLVRAAARRRRAPPARDEARACVGSRLRARRARLPARRAARRRSRWSSGARSSTAPAPPGRRCQRPDTVHAFKLDARSSPAIAVPLNTVFGDRLRARDRAPAVPGQGARERVRRPAARALARRRRAGALPALRPRRLVRRLAAAATASRCCSRCRRWCSRRSSSRCRSSRARSCRRCARSATSRSRPRTRSAPRRWQTFWRITLPSIRWAVIYGVVLTTARCLGEYGAVAVVSGPHRGPDRDGDAARPGALRELRPARGVRDLAACSPRSRCSSSSR